MAENKTQRTTASVEEVLVGVSERRREESAVLIDVMVRISGQEPTMWGPSIIGFGTMHYRYASGREGDMPILAFSPRKSKLTIYFDGFDHYADQLAVLGKHTSSVACLYATKLADLDLDVLTTMLEKCHARSVALES